jgi:UPF0755 protein
MRKIWVVLGILAVFAVIALFWWQNGLLPADSSNKTPKIFIVQPGDGVRQIANNLKKEGLIRDSIVFFLYTKQNGLDKQIQAGDFRLNSSMNAREVANQLTHGTLDIWVTIPEGSRADEIADNLKKNLPSYDESWRAELNKNEGYLFPDTYLIPRGADVKTVISLMKNNFESKYSTVTPSKGLTKEEVVIIASMVEREARHDEDRPLVASVILNRYNIGMKLDIDATIQYALGYQTDQKRWWKKGLTINDVRLDSPYNTYQIAGLPPTPISNPGVESLQAVTDPAETNYIFYITDSKGINHYAETLEQHNSNIKKYGL